MKSKRLKKELTLTDVYAISTGAMFSSGFFLLPGLAFGLSGAWMVLAYFLSALLVVPSMLSKAELSSAMPRAGGTYYFLDRSMGPLVGTVGGLGTWVALGLKNTFALIGMGAYLGLVVDLPIEAVALVLTVVFTLFNIVGAKETAGLQRILVFAMVTILGVFILAGLAMAADAGLISATAERFGAAPGSEVDGLFATVGLVFVSYAGLTKAVSVAEEVENPDRNLIRGMTLSVVTAAVIYVLGAYVLVMVVDHETLATDLTPIATAAGVVFDWLPAKVGLVVILVAAIAAFASTANAGIMAASRYLLAMGRDSLIPMRFSHLGRRRTPTAAILVSGGFVVVCILALDVLTVAKLASAFQLLIFALVNLAVIVMRESQLESYMPVYKSPFYPWTQLLGIFFSLALIVQLGQVPMLFSLLLVAACLMWFFGYAKKRVVREGAILHWFERLGRGRFELLDTELRRILGEKGLRVGDPFHGLVRSAPVLDLAEGTSFHAVVERVSEELAKVMPLDATAVGREFMEGTRTGATLVDRGVALPHFRAVGLDRASLVIVRVRGGVGIDVGDNHLSGETHLVVQALFFLVSPEDKPGQHLRVLAKLASLIVGLPGFLETWKRAADGEALRALISSDVERRAPGSEPP